MDSVNLEHQVVFECGNEGEVQVGGRRVLLQRMAEASEPFEPFESLLSRKGHVAAVAVSETVGSFGVAGSLFSIALQRVDRRRSLRCFSEHVEEAFTLLQNVLKIKHRPLYKVL